jgi:uncharacterized LabA/DUF88 family protein
MKKFQPQILVTKKLMLLGQAAVLIDWANMHGWEKSLKREVNPRKLFNYLKTYKQIKQISFYFGTDQHPKSKNFLRRAKRIGYTVVTKPVKYILIAEVENKNIYRLKCDFDMEMCMDVYQAIEDKFDSFIFFTGDGDFEPLYKMLIKKKKQVIVVYMYGHLGREIFQMKKGIYKISIETLDRRHGNLLSKK